MTILEQADPEVYQAIANEARRQQQGLELIASENYASPAVMAAEKIHPVPCVCRVSIRGASNRST